DLLEACGRIVGLGERREQGLEIRVRAGDAAPPGQSDEHEGDATDGGDSGGDTRRVPSTAAHGPIRTPEPDRRNRTRGAVEPRPRAGRIPPRRWRLPTHP